MRTYEVSQANLIMLIQGLIVILLLGSLCLRAAAFLYSLFNRKQNLEKKEPEYKEPTELIRGDDSSPYAPPTVLMTGSDDQDAISRRPGRFTIGRSISAVLLWMVAAVIIYNVIDLGLLALFPPKTSGFEDFLHRISLVLFLGCGFLATSAIFKVVGRIQSYTSAMALTIIWILLMVLARFSIVAFITVGI